MSISPIIDSSVIISNYKKFIFDLDGTLYKGDDLISGAKELIDELRYRGNELLFITNKTTNSDQEYISYLSSKGIEVKSNELITASFIACRYLKNNFSGKNFFALAENNFIKELVKSGLRYCENPEKIDLVLVSLDRTLNYDKLEIASRALEKGANFFAANIDDTCPVEDGEIIDAGSSISLLEKRTNKKLEKYFGKPSSYLFDEIKTRWNNDLSNAVIIGDRIQTDIQLGNINNIDTVLVNSGVCNDLSIDSIKPTHIINSVKDLL